jgi:hypothetical protein
LPVEIFLKKANFLKQSSDLIFNLCLNATEFNSVISAQLVLVNGFDKNLTLLETRSHLVGQPSSNWSSTGCLWVLSVVDNVLLNHAPVLMSKFEGCMNIAKHQEARVAVLKSKILKLCFNALSAQPVYMGLMIERTILPQLEQILGQLVLWVVKTEGAIS